jgi:hypothetical protein
MRGPIGTPKFVPTTRNRSEEAQMFKRIVVATAVLAAALALSAGASADTHFLPPLDPATAPPRTTYVATTTAAVPAVSSESTDFAWGDAALGAAAALVLVGTASLIVVVGRRRQRTTGSLT